MNRTQISEDSLSDIFEDAYAFIGKNKKNMIVCKIMVEPNEESPMTNSKVDGVLFTLHNLFSGARDAYISLFKSPILVKYYRNEEDQLVFRVITSISLIKHLASTQDNCIKMMLGVITENLAMSDYDFDPATNRIRRRIMQGGYESTDTQDSMDSTLDIPIYSGMHYRSKNELYHSQMLDSIQEEKETDSMNNGNGHTSLPSLNPNR